MTGPATVGWCPGALRPMRSRDGLILRVKPSGGRLTLDQASLIAHLSIRHGSGQIDLTSRANVQIRGVAAAMHDRLVEDLQAAGLVDRSASVEAVRNIVASPLAGVDPAISAELPPALRALEDRLADDEGLHDLPAKWSFVFDGGGLLPLSSLRADVRLVFAQGGRVLLKLQGLSDGAWVHAAQIPDLVSKLGRMAAGRRMGDLAQKRGRSFWERFGPSPSSDEPAAPVSAHHPLDICSAFVGFAPPFGGLAANDLLAAIDALRAADATEIRLTPWRVLLAPGVGDGTVLRRTLGRLGFVVDRNDPRLAVTACVGAPACHRATTPTRVHAAHLAGQVASRIQIAGCDKGCGRDDAATWTLVGRDGRYDLLAGGLDRGVSVARGLSFRDAAARLSRAGQARTA